MLFFSSAPSGCAQYFVAQSGSFKSYNFDGQSILDNMDYNIWKGC